MEKLKVLVLGPSNAGKSFFSNVLSDIFTQTKDNVNVGCRILEFELQNVQLKSGTSVNFDVQLWDVSGSEHYSNGWPCIVNKLNAIIFLVSPNINSKDGFIKSINDYLSVNNYTNIENTCVMVNHRDTSTNDVTVDLPECLQQLKTIHINPASDGKHAKSCFSKFLSCTFENLKKRTEKEEIDILEN